MALRKRATATNEPVKECVVHKEIGFELFILLIGLFQLAITWYKIRYAGGQAHYYSRTGTLKQRDLNQ